MKFSSIIGQKSFIQHLIRSVRENHISNTQLFTGPEGSGILPLAIAYAQYIMCENKGEEDSCGVCPACLKNEKLVHPDLHFVFPVIKSSDSDSAISDEYLKEWREAVLSNPYLNLNKWVEKIASENKQAGIFEAESYRILEKLSFKSFESDYKIMIIWMAEKMNIHCANKLLKILEEPPSKTIFILVSENSDMLLPTVLSRCQSLRIPPIDNNEIRDFLKTRNIPEERINDIIKISSGNFNKVLQLIEMQEEDKQWLDFFIQLMRIAFKKDVFSIIEWSNEMASLGREKQKRFLFYALKMIRNNFALNLAGKDVIYLNKEESDFSINFLSLC